MAEVTVKIKSWTYAKTLETVEHGTASGKETGEQRKRETVSAVFTVEAPDFPRQSQTRRYNGKPAQVVRPELLRITFTSDDGQAWTGGWTRTLVATNVKKDGSLGARVDVNTWDWPPEIARALDIDDRSDAFNWVRAEYPR